MNKEQENRLSMYYAVAKYLDEHSTELGTVPALVAAAVEFQANIKALESATEKQVIDITGFAKDKAEAEDKMITLTLAVAGGTRAYATVQGDSVLAGKMNVTVSALRKHRDAVVAQHCQAIHGAANAVVADLADYGVTTALLADLQSAIDRYVAAIAAPRAAITDRKGATAEIRELMKDTTKLLVKRIDSLVEQFRASNPDLVRGYADARIIVDHGKGSAGEAPGALAA